MGPLKMKFHYQFFTPAQNTECSFPDIFENSEAKKKKKQSQKDKKAKPKITFSSPGKKSLKGAPTDNKET